MGTFKKPAIFGLSEKVLFAQLKTAIISLEHYIYLIKIKVFESCLSKYDKQTMNCMLKLHNWNCKFTALYNILMQEITKNAII